MNKSGSREYVRELGKGALAKKQAPGYLIEVALLNLRLRTSQRRTLRDAMRRLPRFYPLVISGGLALAVLAYVLVSLYAPEVDESGVVVMGNEILLPLPTRVTTLTVEEVILLRKSIRSWRREPIDVQQLSMLLWAAQGIVEHAGYGWYRRAAPSAGATYPVEVYVVVGERGVRLSGGEFLKAGVYKYDYMRHSLRLVKEGDFRVDLWRASLRQDWVREAPVTIVLCAVYERTTGRYGERGIRYVHMELGHVGQNIYLMATALGLGTVAVGAFYDEEVARVVSVARDERPLYLFPVGVPQEPFRTTFEELGKLYESLRKGSPTRPTTPGVVDVPGEPYEAPGPSGG